MRCATLAIRREFVPGMDTVPGMFLASKDAFLTEGIDVDIDELAIKLDGNTRVGINSRRFATDRSAFHQEGRKLSILKATVATSPTGWLELVPAGDANRFSVVPQPQVGSDDGILLLLDLGKGGYTSVRYETAAGNVVARGFSNHALLPEPEEVLLAMLKPNSSIWALRCTKKWGWWGAETVRERLCVRFNGETVSVHKLDDLQPRV